jgi:hypothetical protein
MRYYIYADSFWWEIHMLSEINVVLYFEPKGRTIIPGYGGHYWGEVRARETNRKIGVAYHCRTSQYHDRFSINNRLFSYLTRPKSKCEFICFESSLSRIQRILPISAVVEIYRKVGPLQPPGSDYTVMTLEELDGKEPDVTECPF